MRILALGTLLCVILTPRLMAADAYHPVMGPRRVDLGDHLAHLNLPAGFFFLSPTETVRVMTANGDRPSGQELGLVGATDKHSDWAVVIRYDACGHVTDEDRTQLDPSALLPALKAETEDRNEDRRLRGFPPLEVNGWSQIPVYDGARHVLTWAFNVASPRGTSVNYSTRMLGRAGVLSFNLVADPQHLEADKKPLGRLLEATAFEPGQRYEDFHPPEDRSSGYGLAGLITGRVGDERGVLARMWDRLAASRLAWILGIAVGVVGVRAWHRRGKISLAA